MVFGSSLPSSTKTALKCIKNVDRVKTFREREILFHIIVVQTAEHVYIIVMWREIDRHESLWYLELTRKSDIFFVLSVMSIDWIVLHVDLINVAYISRHVPFSGHDDVALFELRIHIH